MTVFSSRAVCLAGLLGLAMASQAATFSYSPGDLVIALRPAGGGASDLIINAGPVSVFTNLPVGNKITITNLAGAKLASTFGDTNNLSWSAFAYFDATYPVPAEQKTLFMTRARTVLGTQSTPWLRKNSSVQGSTGGQCGQVGTAGVTIGGTLPADSNNTDTLLVEPEGNPSSYKNLLVLTTPNWRGQFQGNPEQTTPATFTTDGQPVRADFYWLVPGSGNGTFLGYFEMNTNGVLAYTSGPSASTLVQPNIVNITRSGTTNTVYFTTGSSGSYSLMASSDLTIPKASWPQVGSSVTGNGLTNSIQDVSALTQRFYLIKAQ